MQNLSRRGLLRALAALGAGGAACSRYRGAEPVATVPAGWNRGEERWVATTCGQCPAGCGIRVRVYEGRAVKIEGNPDHPINSGGIGPKGQSGLQLLYHPDRIHSPMRRNGPRGSGRWTPITWEAAVGEVANRLGALRRAGDSRSVVVIDGEPRGVVPRFWERFLAAYGSPNHVRHASATDGAAPLAAAYMHGAPDAPGYDWANTEYVIGFGVRLFESWCQTIHMSRAAGSMKRDRGGRRVKFVHVASEFSPTTAKADEWVPIEPGTYGALALGIAHVLVRDALFDAAFVREHTFGFEDWQDGQGRMHGGFRDLLAKEYTPAKVSAITGVPAPTIERLAREMSGHRPAVALADVVATGATNGMGTAMAIHALNALVGSVERPGGVLAQRPALAAWPPVVADDIAVAGAKSPRIDGCGTPACALGNGAVQFVPEAVMADRPYAVQALLLYRSNPVFSKPDGARWIDAIKKVPFVVSFSPLPDESTLWADLVLPDQTYLERFEVVEPAPALGRQVLALRQPVVRPHHDAMATGEVIIRIARALGGSVGAAFPWSNYEAATKEAAATALDALQKRAVWAGDDYPFEQWDRAFDTPSRRFEFYSQAIAAKLAAVFPEPDTLDRYLATACVGTRGDALCMPHWEPPQHAGGAEEFPFVLVPHRGIHHAEGGARHLPWLCELPSAGLLAWKETVELHPDDAQRLAVSAGEQVWVESMAGRRRLTVRVDRGTRPGTVGVPLGLGAWPPTPETAATSGANGLLTTISDPLSGALALEGTRVRVRKEEA